MFGKTGYNSWSFFVLFLEPGSIFVPFLHKKNLSTGKGTFDDLMFPSICNILDIVRCCFPVIPESSMTHQRLTEPTGKPVGFY